MKFGHIAISDAQSVGNQRTAPSDQIAEEHGGVDLAIDIVDATRY